MPAFVSATVGEADSAEDSDEENSAQSSDEEYQPRRPQPSNTQRAAGRLSTQHLRQSNVHEAQDETQKKDKYTEELYQLCERQIDEMGRLREEKKMLQREIERLRSAQAASSAAEAAHARPVSCARCENAEAELKTFRDAKEAEMQTLSQQLEQSTSEIANLRRQLLQSTNEATRQKLELENVTGNLDKAAKDKKLLNEQLARSQSHYEALCALFFAFWRP